MPIKYSIVLEEQILKTTMKYYFKKFFENTFKYTHVSLKISLVSAISLSLTR